MTKFLLRKIILIIIVGLFFSFSFAEAIVFKRGDMDADGAYTVVDVRELLNFVLDNESTTEFAEEDLELMDMSLDDTIDIVDVRLLLQLVVNPPVEPAIIVHAGEHGTVSTYWTDHNTVHIKVIPEDGYYMSNILIDDSLGYCYDYDVIDDTTFESYGPIEADAIITVEFEKIYYYLWIDLNGCSYDGETTIEGLPGDQAVIGTPVHPISTIYLEPNGGTVENTTLTWGHYTGWTFTGIGTFDGTTFTFGEGNARLEAESTKGVCLPVPERENYRFLGWYTSDNIGPFETGTELALRSGIVLYARWASN